MNDLMSSVSTQIQRAINEAMNEQVLPQIQATLRFGPGQVPNRRSEVQARRPECRSEEVLNRNFRSSFWDELFRDFDRNEDLEFIHYRGHFCSFNLYKFIWSLHHHDVLTRNFVFVNVSLQNYCFMSWDETSRYLRDKNRYWKNIGATACHAWARAETFNGLQKVLQILCVEKNKNVFLAETRRRHTSWRKL